MHAFRVLFFILSLLHFSNTLQAQSEELELHAYLNKDTIVLGEPFVYSLSIHYPDHYDVHFPDSNYFYGNLEWIKKSYTNTSCSNNMCTDSIQYTLRTFSTDSILYPSVPVFLFSDKITDTLFIHPEEKKLFVTKLNHDQEKYTWQENVNYLTVQDSINYWYYGFTLLVFFFMVFLFYIAAGPYIFKRIKLFSLTRNHKRFIKEFDESLLLFSSNKKPSDLEKCVTLWKEYLTRLETKPYNTLTTKELEGMQDMEDIINPLQNLDRFLYGGLSKTENMESLNALRRFSTKRFLRKKKELRNARKV